LAPSTWRTIRLRECFIVERECAAHENPGVMISAGNGDSLSARRASTACRWREENCARKMVVSGAGADGARLRGFAAGLGGLAREKVC